MDQTGQLGPAVSNEAQAKHVMRNHPERIIDSLTSQPIRETLVAAHKLSLGATICKWGCAMTTKTIRNGLCICATVICVVISASGSVSAAERPAPPVSSVEPVAQGGVSTTDNSPAQTQQPQAARPQVKRKSNFFGLPLLGLLGLGGAGAALVAGGSGNAAPASP